MWPNACCLSPSSAMYHGRALGQAAVALTGMCMQALGTQVHCCVVRGCRPKCLCTGACTSVCQAACTTAPGPRCASRGYLGLTTERVHRCNVSDFKRGTDAWRARARSSAALRSEFAELLGDGGAPEPAPPPGQSSAHEAALHPSGGGAGAADGQKEKKTKRTAAALCVHAGDSTGAGGGGAAASGPGAVKRKKRRRAAAEGGAAVTGGLESSSPAAGLAEMEEGAVKGRAAVPGGGSKGAIAKSGGALDDAMAALGMPCSKTVHQSQSYLTFCDGQLLAVRCACAN
jgi:hypothetical protein